MTIFVLYFLACVVVSFVCSLSEAVFLSLTPSQIHLMIENGRYGGHHLKKLKEKVDRPLAAILTLNTVANTVGAAGVGVQSLVLFGEEWVAFFSALLTVSILVISEIIPKTLGTIYCQELASVAAFAIRVLIVIVYPLVIAFEALSRVIAGKRRPTRITREELMVAADMSGASGHLHDQERSIIRNLLHLEDVDVRDVMTPRSVLFALSKDETVEEAIRNHQPIRFSRIPIFGRDLDNITGLVRRYQINQAHAQGQKDLTLEALADPIHVVPESKSVAAVLNEFIKRRVHLFLVVDEYGGTAGIISLEDAIETLLGVEIVDELDSVVDMRQLARELWEKRKKAREG